MTEVRLPRMGEALTEGVLVEFYVADGQFVGAGEPLYLIETDKVSTEIPAPVSGVVRHVATAGTEYPVGELLATIDER